MLLLMLGVLPGPVQHKQCLSFCAESSRRASGFSRCAGEKARAVQVASFAVWELLLIQICSARQEVLLVMLLMLGVLPGPISAQNVLEKKAGARHTSGFARCVGEAALAMALGDGFSTKSA